MSKSTIFYVILGLISFIIMVSIIWRFSSSRIKIPCPSWLGWMVEVDNPFSKINSAATIIEHLELKPKMSVLDAGCGPGRVTIPIAQKIGPQGNVTALDIQEGMLDRVKEKAQSSGLSNITLLHAGLGDGKLGQNSYDRAILVSVLGEIPNQKAALQEIFNALKPGGILSITEIIFDPHYQRLSRVLNLAKEIGFEKQQEFTDWCAYTLLLGKPY